MPARYRLAPGYHLPPIAFTVEEAVQLLGSDLAPARDSGATRGGTPAAAKVEAALRPRHTLGCRQVAAAYPCFDDREPTPWLPLQQAVWGQVIWLRYHSFSSMS
jgi:predicted DNA-binding transcriptional regulator YafY